ncbi:MAG: type II secretion system F family protein [Actinomycetota bacterium]|nr:type II secretion system F family protein [Actinomycetota bacterium]MDQ6944824.1 type II secretion system F family protein [Actinomycetota bacterium]
MILPLLLALGAGIGIGFVLVVASVRRPPPVLADALIRISTPRGLLPADATGDRVLVALGQAVGLERLLTTTVRTDLRALGRTTDAHLARSMLTALELGLVPPAVTGLLALSGTAIPVAVPVGVAVCFALGGALLPTAALHREAEKRRRSFKHALGAFFNLVGINIAAGKGIEGALETAAAAGDGEAFREIRQALYRAKITGETPWAGLDGLGEEIGVAELRELAAAVGLAGDIGARVRASLAAKAQTLRHRGLSDIEEAANAANERMSLPIVLLVLSFIVFIGYPAVDRIMTGL